MSNIFVKQCLKSVESMASDDAKTRGIVSAMLDKILAEGCSAVEAYSKQLDGYEGSIVVTAEEMEEASNTLDPQLKEDIEYAHRQITLFAQAQRDSISDFELEISPGVFAGQRLIPMSCAGCYVPGGRYAHIASAIMSIATAKTAGVEYVIAASPPPVHKAILYACKLSGADMVLALGGVQAIASMAYGLFTPDRYKANILVGPGNKYVAEAKQMLHSTMNIGIDMFAGPTEIGIIGDEEADANLICEDLCSQVEHGPESPAWLFTTSNTLANDVSNQIDSRIASLPKSAREAAQAAWRDYGKIIVCSNDEEVCRVSDAHGAEHLELHTNKNDWYVEKLKNYGSLFVGEETTVSYGDKCSGTNHILPTKQASFHTGGLSVHKFMKIVTTQRMTKEATRQVGCRTARISREEGMEGHARAADIRLKKYFPQETFDVGKIRGPDDE